MANAPVAGTEEEQPSQPETTPSDSEQPEEQAQEQQQGEVPDVDAHLQSFLEESGLSDEAAQGDGGTEPDSGEEPPEVLERAQQIAEVQRQEERRQRELEGIKTSFAQRAGAIRTTLLQQNVNPQVVEAIVNEFNNHHAQSATVAKDEAMAEAVSSFNEALFQTMDKSFTGLKGKRDFKSLDDFMKSVTKEARKGFISEKDHKADVQAKLTEFKKSLEEKGFVTSKAPPKDNDTVDQDQVSSLEWSLNAPIEEIMRAKAARLGA